jgi:exonuclease VII large subunit
MNYKDYLEKGPDEGSTELIELLADRIRQEVTKDFTEKADKQLEEAGEQLKYLTTKYIESLKQRSHQLNEQMLEAERQWHTERHELAKINIEYRKKTEQLEISRKKSQRAQKFYYISGAIWFLAVAALIIKFFLL